MKQYIEETFTGLRVLEAAGDTYFLYDPQADLPPERQQPFATIVTGDRHDRVSDLDRPGAYRLNIGLTRATYTARFGAPPTRPDAEGVLDTGFDQTTTDTLMPHPVYASHYWVVVVNPGEQTLPTVRTLLVEAHGFAARKYARQEARRQSAEGPAEGVSEG